LLHGVLDAVGLEFSIVFSCYMDTTWIMYSLYAHTSKII
jgi:hypothetical protein